ncbi:MAG: hypothetical protein HUK15_04945, partial [Bacteroidales bacterium]|nr:hypothetical protein [Bacteroidales bacterium]
NEFLFNNLPLYNKFRTPSMSLVIANVSMVMMAILALKAIFDKDNAISTKKLNVALYVSTGITCGFMLLVLALSGGFSFSGVSDEQMAMSYGDSWSQLERIFVADRKALFVSDTWRSVVLVLLSAATIFVAIRLKDKKYNVVFASSVAILSVLMLFDLWNVDRRYLNDDSYVSQKDIQLKPSEDDKKIDMYAEQFGDKDYRVLNLAANTFNDSRTSAFHHSIGGYHGAKLRRYQDLIDFYLSTKINMNVINMLNARYVIVGGSEGNIVQRNSEACGSAWLVANYQLVENANEEILALNDFNPKEIAVVDKRFGKFVQNKKFASDSTASIEMLHQKPYNPDYLAYNVECKSEQLAVFSEIYYEPDWKAYIDGQPADYFRADYVLRAMVVPAGNHKIEFKNEAPMIHVWNIVSVISSVIIVLLVAVCLFFHYRRKKNAEKLQ